MRSLIDAYLRTTNTAPSSDHMEVDAVNKGNGKGKCKNNGKDKVGKKKDGTQAQSNTAKNNSANNTEGTWNGQFQGYCSYCGGWGHRQKDCKKDPKGMASGRPAVSAGSTAAAVQVNAVAGVMEVHPVGEVDHVRCTARRGVGHPKRLLVGASRLRAVV